jgi:hypothetical protein
MGIRENGLLVLHFLQAFHKDEEKQNFARQKALLQQQQQISSEVVKEEKQAVKKGKETQEIVGQKKHARTEDHTASTRTSASQEMVISAAKGTRTAALGGYGGNGNTLEGGT